MCGIVGGIGVGAADAVSKNLFLLERRGPDSSKVLTLGNGLTLGATRLAMTDPLDRSNQPMIDTMSGNAIVFNGEIYNYKSIKQQLTNRGIFFDTQSDTEVILKALTLFGPKIISDFEGMFAFSFYDKANNRVIMSRDYLGKKPLYYFLEGQKFFFSSQVKIIKDYVKTLQINIESISTYLLLGYLIDPETMFRGVNSIRPGEILTFDLNNITLKSITTFIPKMISQPIEADISKSFDMAITERVDGHSKIAISLSGGVDSSLIAMQCKKLGLNVYGYTMGWQNSDKYKYNLDAVQSKIIAKEIGIGNRIIEMPTAKQIPIILDEFVNAMDQPNANPTGLSMMFLYSQIAKDGYRLVLTGDGSDEVFGGYERYRIIRKFEMIPRIDNRLARSLAINLDLDKALIRKVMFLSVLSDSPESWFYWHLICNKKRLKKLGVSTGSEIINLYGDELSSIYSGGNGSVSHIMFKDLRTWLSMESNRKLDCVSMWHSIEARSPFQSERLIGQGYAKMKSSNFSKIRKEILFESFPQLQNMSILKDKKGFISPLGYWLRNNYELINYSIKSISEYLPLNQKELIKLSLAPSQSNFNDMKVLWSLIVLNKWFENNG
jgi:asparagine synthase (glutamine-hydrolysing)